MHDRDLHHHAVSRAAANDHFKRSFGTWLWGSVVTATALHFAMFLFWPDMTAADHSRTVVVPEVVPLAPEVPIPPEPPPISRPAVPVIATADISEDITISPTTFLDNPVTTLPDPPEDEARSLIDAPVITPMTVFPSITNRREFQRALEREYPAILRVAGVATFTPALNLDKVVPVWIRIPITFQAR